MKILIIEDDYGIIEAIQFSLQAGWPEAKISYTRRGEEGIKLVETESPDVILLDLGLPDINGFEVLKGIRLFSDIPVLILTISGEESNIVKGLSLGADDYVAKPFKPLELLARINAIYRRRHLVVGEIYQNFGKFRYNVSSRQLHYEGKTVQLTNTEALLLNHLLINAGKVVTHNSLAENIWGVDYPDSINAIRVYVRRLREKIEINPDKPQFIITKPGIGYLLQK